MNGAAQNARMWPLWRRNLPVWAALVALLGITFGVAYLPLGPFNLVASLGIATLKAMLVGLFFMNLRRSAALIRLAAAAGFFWLVILFALTFTDVLTRVPLS